MGESQNPENLEFFDIFQNLEKYESWKVKTGSWKIAKSQIIIIKTHSQLVRGALVSYSAYIIPLSLINVLATFYASTMGSVLQRTDGSDSARTKDFQVLKFIMSAVHRGYTRRPK